MTKLCVVSRGDVGASEKPLAISAPKSRSADHFTVYNYCNCHFGTTRDKPRFTRRIAVSATRPTTNCAATSGINWRVVLSRAD
jgi:hypothetical protein